MTVIYQVREKWLRVSKRLGWFPPLLSRVSVGVVFIQSGWGKLHHLEKVIGFFRELGIPAPQLLAPFVAGVEFGCGLLVFAGLFTRLAGVPLIATMAVAIITAKREDISGIGDLFGLMEFLMAVLLIWLVIAGPGAVSLDRLIVSRSRRPD